MAFEREISARMDAYRARTLQSATETVKRHVEDARKVNPVAKACLFGSWAKGTQRELNDVGVCFFLEDLDGKSEFEAHQHIFDMKEPYLGALIEPRVINDKDLEAFYSSATVIIKNIIGDIERMW
jgi:predicted nucleotidyltransferase